MNWRRVSLGLFWLAACLALVASLYILIAPVQVHEVTAVSGEDGSTQTTVIHQVSWYQVQGAWGVIFVSLLAALYGLTAFFAHRERTWSGIVSGVLAIMLTLLASLSVGPLYYPAMLIELLAAAAAWIGRLRLSNLSDPKGPS